MKRILVIRVGRVGDMVMITPSLRALLDNFPDYELHLLTSADGKRVLSGFNNRVTKLYIYKRRGITSYIYQMKKRKEIQESGYDYIFNFELKTFYKKLYRGLNVAVFELDESERHLNYAKRCLNVVQKAVGKGIGDYWDWLPVSEKGMEKAEQQLLDVGISDDDFIIGIHPSFSGLKRKIFSYKSQKYLRKKWPPEYFAEVARRLADYGTQKGINLKIIMDLLPDESELGKKIVKESGGNIILFTPKPDFERYKALIKRMDLLITPDTGPMHIAAAVGTKNISLFSGKSPEDCGPYMESDKYYILQAEKYTTNDINLRAIKSTDVVEACKRFLPAGKMIRNCFFEP